MGKGVVRMKWYDIRFWKWALIVLVVGIVALVFAGCKSKEYITVPEYHTEYICRTDTFAKLDSVYLKDSVYVYHKGDTVYHNKVTYRDRWHNIYKVKTDTIIKSDSVVVPYPVTRELTRNEQRLMTLGRLFIGFLFLVIGTIVVTLFWYKNKK